MFDGLTWSALSIQFVDWLYKVLMFNLVPGACYQRRQTSLDLLVVMLETLVYQRETTARKGRAQGKEGVVSHVLFVFVVSGCFSNSCSSLCHVVGGSLIEVTGTPAILAL